MELKKDFRENISLIQNVLPLEKSFDIIGREFKTGTKSGYMVFVDGFAKDEIMYYIISTLQEIKYDLPFENYISNLIKEKISYLETDTFTALDEMAQAVLSGSIAIVIEGESTGIIVDAREYPARGPEEAETEKVTRGSKDGFVETLVFNTALIRRRVRDKNLTFEMKSVGESSKTDVCLGYIEGLADEHLLENLRKKIDSIEIQSLVMAEKSLEELLLKKKWYNPLPQVKYTQRPDIAASYLFEGHVVILVDTSPSVMVAPATLFYFTQYAEDYYQNPLVGTYNRFVRFLAIITALLLTPLWFMLAENSHLLPQFLSFIGTKEASTVSLLVQFLILEFGFDLLRMSSLHTPSYLGGAFGIIGGLLLGEFAIKVGFFVPETIFYSALVSMAGYCIPNIEFSSAIRIFRLLLLVLTGLFGIWGFFGGLILIFIITATTETMDKTRKYLWPLIPFDGKVLSDIIFRKPVSTQSNVKKK